MDIDVRPSRTVNLTKYGYQDSQIVLEPLDFFRKKQLQNNLGKTTHVNANSNDFEMKSQDLGDLSVYRVMAYITSAPFKYDSLDGFYNFMKRLDQKRFGSAEELFKELEDAIKSLKEETNPLAESMGSETQNSVPEF